VSDDLTDADLVEAAHFYYGHTARETIEELSRLRAVEDAAALLLDACDAREAAGMTTGAAEVREFLRDVRRTT
jgi:hypothetical protein